MKYRRLGRWGVKVSEIGLGSWLTYGGPVEEQVASDCVHRAYDLGVNFFDTANAYMRGGAEEVYGRSLADLPRDQIVLATKVFFPMGRGPNDGGLSRKHVTEQCHASLRRLQVDYVDLYQCHRYDPGTPLEETCRVMDDLISAGKILYWGVSEWSAEQIEAAVTLCRAQGWAPPVSNQPQYSALWRTIEESVLPACEEHGLGNVVWSPLAQGVLTGKYTDVEDLPEGTRATGESAGFMQGFLRQEVLDAVALLEPVAKEAGGTTAQLALAWCLRQPAVSSLIVGATKTAHVDDNVAAVDIKMTPDIVARVDEILAPVSVGGTA